MAYNTTDHVYYLKQYSEIKDELTEQQLASFLQDVLEGRAKVGSVICGQVVERKKHEFKELFFCHLETKCGTLKSN